MTSWLVPFDRLSEEQRRAVELPPERHCAIAGGTGSGKSQVVLHRARALASRYGIPPSRFRIVVFSGLQRRFLASACPLLDIPPECVVAFRDLCVEYYRDHIKKDFPWVWDGLGTLPRPCFWHMRPEVERHVLAATAPAFDFLMVDEAQDLDVDAMLLLRLLTRHITATFDPCQQIYPNRVEEDEILAILSLRARTMTLPGCLRCNPHVARLAAAFLEDPVDRQAFLGRDRALPADRETPLIYFEEPFTLLPHLAQTIRERQLVGDRVGVVVPTQKCIPVVAKYLRLEGIDAETRSNWDFRSIRPKIVTCHGCKGLTFDTVCLPMVDTRHRHHWTPLLDDLPRFLFLAVTRATRWVYMSCNFLLALPEIDALFPLEKEGVVVLRHYDSKEGKIKSNPQPETPLDFL